jgi:hypothetical protein
MDSDIFLKEKGVVREREGVVGWSGLARDVCDHLQLSRLRPLFLAFFHQTHHLLFALSPSLSRSLSHEHLLFNNYYYTPPR